jgi:hypothetical protein
MGLSAHLRRYGVLKYMWQGRGIKLRYSTVSSVFMGGGQSCEVKGIDAVQSQYNCSNSSRPGLSLFSFTQPKPPSCTPKTRTLPLPS